MRYSNDKYSYKCIKPALLLLITLSFLLSCGEKSEQKSNQPQLGGGIKVGEITEVVLERSVCHGECPAYKVTLRKDGSATYVGEAFTPFIGTYEADRNSCPECYFEELVKWLELQKFLDLREIYREDQVDSSRITVSITRDGIKKTVVSNDSRSPLELWGIAMAIDGVISKISWKKSTF